MTGDSSSSTWCVPGPDVCLYCAGPTSAEVCYFCAICDRLVCPACLLIERKTQRVLCPECAAEERE